MMKLFTNCNTPLTASYSKGRKEKYAYYHCHNKDCNIKFRVAKSRIESDFVAHLEQIKPKKELLQLFRAILEDTYENSIKEQKTTLNRLNKELEELVESKKKLTKRYLEDKISESDYKLVNEDYDCSIFRTHKKSVIFDFLDQLTDNKFNMGRLMGFEPMHIGTTIRGLNHLTTGAINIYYNNINNN